MEKIICISQHPKYLKKAALWFASKWGVPLEAYEESMQDALTSSTYPEWYIALEQDEIMGGLGVIQNDFHDRKDLFPNVCAVYVEEKYRNHGLAGRLLKRVTEDMKKRGITTLYLITDHTSFYERYGWKFYVEAKSDDGGFSRIYIHDSK